VGLVERPGDLADHLRGRVVFVHLDLDVLDPTVMPAKFPAPGGLSDGGLRTLLAEVAEAVELVGVEITAFSAPERARRVATIVEPLLPAGAG
jgi:arginase family enzyme